MSYAEPDAPEAPRRRRWIRMPRQERGGFMWGMDGPEFGILVACVMSIMLMLMLQRVLAAGAVALIAVPLGASCAFRWRNRSVIRHVAVKVQHKVKLALGNTRWRFAEAPIKAGEINLPGEVGARVTVHTTKYKNGAFFYDAKTQRATAVLRCESAGWGLESDSDRAMRGNAFKELLNGLVRRSAIERVVNIARTIPSETTAAVAAHDQVVADREVDDPWIQPVMDSVFAGDGYVDKDGDPLGPEHETAAVTRDCLVAVSISVPRAYRQIKSYGGSLDGAGQVLNEELKIFQDKLPDCGVTNSRWLSAAELSDVVRLAIDPGAVEILAQSREDRDLDEFSTGVALLVDDANPKYLVTNGGIHSTWWISEWPQTAVGLGFLEDMICQGDYTQTVTEVLTAVPTGSGLRQVRKALQALQSKFVLNEKLGRRTSPLDTRAQVDLESREDELADGQVDVRCVGYVRLSASDEDTLAIIEEKMTSAAGSMDLQRLDGQHWQGFVASSVPIGWGM